VIAGYVILRRDSDMPTYYAGRSEWTPDPALALVYRLESNARIDAGDEHTVLVVKFEAP
jgi:hypothetical protein